MAVRRNTDADDTDFIKMRRINWGNAVPAAVAVVSMLASFLIYVQSYIEQLNTLNNSISIIIDRDIPFIKKQLDIISLEIKNHQQSISLIENEITFILNEHAQLKAKINMEHKRGEHK